MEPATTSGGAMHQNPSIQEAGCPDHGHIAHPCQQVLRREPDGSSIPSANVAKPFSSSDTDREESRGLSRRGKPCRGLGSSSPRPPARPLPPSAPPFRPSP